MKRYTTVEVQLKAKSKVNSQKPLELKIPESQFQRNWWKKHNEMKMMMMITELKNSHYTHRKNPRKWKAHGNLQRENQVQRNGRKEEVEEEE